MEEKNEEKAWQKKQPKPVPRERKPIREQEDWQAGEEPRPAQDKGGKKKDGGPRR